MRLFKLGIVRVLICTDAAGMGCDLPDIDLVVQWKMPGSVSAFVQRAGRAARDPTRKGLGVLLVEKTAYEVDIIAQMAVPAVPGNTKAKKRGKKTKEKKVKAGKEYSEARGAARESYGGKKDAILTKYEPPLDVNAPDEGLHVLVQTGICRRRVLTKIYGNGTTTPTAPCCDLCNPELLDQIRPAPPLRVPRQSSTKRGIPERSTQEKLHEWRTIVFKRDFGRSLFGPAGIMKDETIELLSSVGPIRSRQALEKVLAGQWTWYGKYGDELLAWLMTVNMPEMKSKPKKPRGIKRASTQAPANMPAAVRARPSVAAIPEPSALPSQIPQAASQSVPQPFPVYAYAPQVPMSYWPISQPQQFQLAPQQFQAPNSSHFPAHMHHPPPMRTMAPMTFPGTPHSHPYQHLTSGSSFSFSVPLQPANSTNSAANSGPQNNPYQHLGPHWPQPPNNPPGQ
ncbi:hypothetical protein C8J56DRAFT_1037395 [Mycena floridula]|nr:hypothetical protein C8J56DRAFT_1037395 [Mycena floridula]